MLEAMTANPIFFRTYSRYREGMGRESWLECCDRVIKGLQELGKISDEESALIHEQLCNLNAFPSGRWLWVGGTEWVKKPENFFGAYNCSSTNLNNWDAFGHLMNLAMTGCGTGAVLEPDYINQLPPILNTLNIQVVDEIGSILEKFRLEETQIIFNKKNNRCDIYVGDSREGWVKAYQRLLELSSYQIFPNVIDIFVHLGNLRPAGEKLKGFGGVANPVKFPGLFFKCAKILNQAIGRKLNSVECCLLIDEAALVVVAGSIRRSAGIRQGSSDDELFANAKANLWQQDENGRWRIDPDRDALRMANHTRVFHHKPTLEECIESVKKQYYSGEGAIQWAGEAIARANIDILNSPVLKKDFLAKYAGGGKKLASAFLNKIYFGQTGFDLSEQELEERMERYGLNPCLTGETLVTIWDETYQVWKLERIDKLAEYGKFVEICDHEGNRCPTIFQQTSVVAGNTSILRIEYEEIFTRKKGIVRCTPLHSWYVVTMTNENNEPISTKKLAGYLSPGDRLLGAASNNKLENNWIITSIAYEMINTPTPVYCCSVMSTHSFDLEDLHSGNCGEIILRNNTCNLSEIHLNQLDPLNMEAHRKAFTAAALSAAILLNHKFTEPRYQQGRESDPIVGVSITGLFDFFVNLFGIEWLQWWAEGRQLNWNDNISLKFLKFQKVLFYEKVIQHTKYEYLSELFQDVEKYFLKYWRKIVEDVVWNYCDHHGLKRPNRCTTVQPGGTKSLLTGACPGWHPPKAQRFIRRITFRKNDPVALACIECGYKVIPGQSDKDENGNLLNDAFSDNCSEWLIEIPVEVPWANLPGVESIDISQFSALSQLNFYMQVQKYYVGHNTSGTIELREQEVEGLGTAIYETIQNDEGYISVALLARFDDHQTFPRLPFEPISKEKYDQMMAKIRDRAKTDDFLGALNKFDNPNSHQIDQIGPAGCDSDKCLFSDIAKS